jgi:hypothetical protein
LIKPVSQEINTAFQSIMAHQFGSCVRAPILNGRFFDAKGKQNLHVFESESEACLRFFEIMTESKRAKKETCPLFPQGTVRMPLTDVSQWHVT